MKVQQCSKSEFKRLDAVFTELGFGKAPAASRKRDLDMICRDRQKETSIESPAAHAVGACGKFGYSSEAAALWTARKRMNSGACRLRVYHCPQCKEWHLTHSAGERCRPVRTFNQTMMRSR